MKKKKKENKFSLDPITKLITSMIFGVDDTVQYFKDMSFKAGENKTGKAAKNEQDISSNEFLRRFLMNKSLEPQTKLKNLDPLTEEPKQVLAAETNVNNDISLTPYENMTLETFRKHKIPESVAYGIAQAEGGLRNKFNIGAPDSNPEAAPIWDDLEAATAAAKLFSGTFTNTKGEVDDRYKPAFKLRKKPVKMLEKIEELEYAGEPSTWKQRSIEQGGAGINYDKWSEFVQDTDSWKKWYKFFKMNRGKK